MKFYKILILYFKFFIFEFCEIFNFSIFINRAKQFGLINLIRAILFNKNIYPKDKYIKIYLDKNLKKWKKLNFKKNNYQILITGFVHLPIYYMMNALIGKFLEEKFKSNSVCILEKGDYFGEAIFRSFNFHKFRYLNKGNMFFRIKKFSHAIKIISKLKNIEEFLKFKINNVYIGKIVYDHYLRHTRNCTTSINNFKIYYLLSKSLNTNLQIKKILKQEKFRYGVQSEHQFLPSAICFQNFLNNKIKIFARNKGPKWITISKFSGSKDIFTPRDKIDYKLFNYFFRKYQKKLSKRGLKIVKNRLKGKDNFSLKSWGISPNKYEKISFKKLKKINSWNENFPVVCVFGHLFADGNFSNGWRIHKDNLSWLLSTLEIIKDIKNIYWIIKPHPLEHKFKTSTSTYNEVAKFEENYPHIKIANERLSNYELSKNISAIVSSHGTAPLEYASLGIPSVVCGNTRYSKLGFLNQSNNINKYKISLNKISKLKKLNLSHRHKANIFTLLAGRLVLIDSEIVPDAVTGQQRLESYKKKDFWLGATKKIEKFDYKRSYLKKMFFNQIDENLDNIFNKKFLSKEIKFFQFF